LFNGNLSSAEEVLPLLKMLIQGERKNLLLAAQKISGEAFNTLVGTASRNKSRLQFVLVDLTRAGDKALTDLQDLALLTGARLFNPDAGDRLTTIQPTDLGSTQRAEADGEFLVVSGGRGNPAEVRGQINALDIYLEGLPFDDSQVDDILMRLGRLSGSMGILKIGAYTQNERDVLHQKAQQGVRALRAAQEGGLLPGGGTAFLHCIALVEQMDCADEDERLGYRALARALRRPFEQLLQNAKQENPGQLAHTITRAAPGLVFDLRQRKIRPASESGVLDAAQTVIASLETASSGAQMALSTDVIILKRKPRISYNP
jgi:chaperonin GroEL